MNFLRGLYLNNKTAQVLLGFEIIDFLIHIISRKLVDKLHVHVVFVLLLLVLLLDLLNRIFEQTILDNVIFSLILL